MGRLAPAEPLELISGPLGSPGEVQEELICRIIVSPASPQQLSSVSAVWKHRHLIGTEARARAEEMEERWFRKRKTVVRLVPSFQRPQM